MSPFALMSFALLPFCGNTTCSSFGSSELRRMAGPGPRLPLQVRHPVSDHHGRVVHAEKAIRLAPGIEELLPGPGDQSLLVKAGGV